MGAELLFSASLVYCSSWSCTRPLPMTSRRRLCISIRFVFFHTCVLDCMCLSVYMQCSEVPQWMFIGWISQMLPLMDKPEGEAVEGILHSISVEYPQVRSLALYVHSSSFVLHIHVYRPSVTHSKSAPMTSNVTTLLRGRRGWRQSIS